MPWKTTNLQSIRGLVYSNFAESIPGIELLQIACQCYAYTIFNLRGGRIDPADPENSGLIVSLTQLSHN